MLILTELLTVTGECTQTQTTLTQREQATYEFGTTPTRTDKTRKAVPRRTDSGTDDATTHPHVQQHVQQSVHSTHYLSFCVLNTFAGPPRQPRQAEQSQHEDDTWHPDHRQTPGTYDPRNNDTDTDLLHKHHTPFKTEPRVVRAVDAQSDVINRIDSDDIQPQMPLKAS